MGRSPKTESGSRWGAVAVALVTMLVMGRLCAADFTWWDDRETIHHNPRMNPPTWGTVGYYWTRPHMGLYVPVTYTVWAALAAVGRVDQADRAGIQLNPWVFHTANVLVHVGNALIVYAILRRVVRKEWAAAVGAMVFGVHPVQVEAVGWVSGMKDLLCGSCVLGAVWAYLVYAAGTAAPRARGAYWVTVILALVGTLCKPTAVVTPLLLLAVGRWAVGRSWRELAGELWPVVLVVLPCVVWARAVQHVGPKGPAWERPLVGLDAIAFYVVKVLWPAALGVDYGRTPGRILETGAVWWTWVVPAALGLLVAVRGRRWPVVVAGAGVFVGGLVPVLGLVPFMFQGFSTVADHYLYIPMLGVGMIAAWVVARWQARPVIVGAAAAVIVALGVRSVVQAGAWQDEEALCRNGIAVNPRSFALRTNLASNLEWRAQVEGSRELREEAIEQTRAALAIRPGEPFVMQNLAEMLARDGQYAEAAGVYRELVRLKPGDAAAELALREAERKAGDGGTTRP